jgi:hypothetical protein
MNELIIYALLLAVWFALQLWILPKMGIPTCMSGACRVPVRSRTKDSPDNETGMTATPKDAP